MYSCVYGQSVTITLFLILYRSPLLIRYRRFNMETKVNTMIPEEGQLFSGKSIKILRIEEILTCCRGFGVILIYSEYIEVAIG